MVSIARDFIESDECNMFLCLCLSLSQVVFDTGQSSLVKERKCRLGMGEPARETKRGKLGVTPQL